MTKENKRFAGILVGVCILLLIPYFAMKFTGEVNWTAIDFVAAGIMLFGTAIICECILRFVKSTGARLVLCGLALLGLMLVWAELAVGLFGTRFAGS
jgi:hypothetical protein